MRKTTGFIRNKGKVNLFQIGRIQKPTPNKTHRRILAENFGIEEDRYSQFSLEDEIIEEPINILLGINVGLDREIIDPASVNLLNTPVLPNIKIIRNPFNDKYCFAGTFGGKYMDFQHPIKGSVNLVGNKGLECTGYIPITDATIYFVILITLC